MYLVIECMIVIVYVTVMYLMTERLICYFGGFLKICYRRPQNELLTTSKIQTLEIIIS